MNRKPGAAGEHICQFLHQHDWKTEIVDSGTAVLLGNCMAQVPAGAGGLPGSPADDACSFPFFVIRGYLGGDELTNGAAIELVVVLEDGPAHHESLLIDVLSL
jgi:hypothetical protein